jgi:hypothetical protein
MQYVGGEIKKSIQNLESCIKTWKACDFEYVDQKLTIISSLQVNILTHFKFIDISLNDEAFTKLPDW